MNLLEFFDGGRPVTNSDLRVLQTLSLTLGSVLLQDVGTCVLSGCQVTPTSTPDRYNVGAGLVWLSRGVYQFDGANNVELPGVFILGPKQTVIERVYQVGGTKPAVSEQKALLDVPDDVGPYTIESDGPLMWYAQIAALQRPIGLIEFGQWSMSDYGTDGLGKGKHRGWAIPDGRNGAADLRARFPVFMDAAVPDYDAAGKTGGLASVQLTANQNGPHNHMASSGQFGYNQLLRKAPLGSNTTANGTDGNGNGGNEPDLTTSQPLADSGRGEAHENRPPYYVLAARQWIGL